jgi:23S rRNA (guanosine2251-2'-O)-methyltransferase
VARQHRDVAPRRHVAPALDFDDVMYGIHTVGEALDAGEPLRSIHVARDRTKDPPLRRVLDLAKERGVHVRFEDRNFFARLPFKAHQGIVAMTQPFEYAGLDDVLYAPRESPLLLVLLDHLTDPHNVGAVLRTAECVGAHAVILPERRSAGVNATVRKASAGAAARIPVVRVTNIAQTVRQLKKEGVWTAGADVASEALPMGLADFAQPVALVIGSEGAGLAPLVKRECDALVRIPMLGRLASLNASVATAVLLYEVLRQRSGPA